MGHCIDYLPDSRQFFVELDNKEKIITSRLCVYFDEIDTYKGLEKRRNKAMTLKKQAFVRLNFERIFIQEMLKLMPMTRQPAFITNGIIKRIGLSPNVIDKDEKLLKATKKMAKQAESVYCYSQAKSAALIGLYRENPKVASMVSGFST